MLLVIERMRKFGAGVPIVFTGDHNCRETEAPAKAVAAILKDALYESKTPPKGSWRTFSGWKWLEREVSAVEALKVPADIRNAKEGSPDSVKLVSGVHPFEKYGARIDYIYVSPGVEVLDFETVNAPRPGCRLYPSDHFPLVATIRF
jgi:endonuclease/exonuclease/phosphatase family metal-dependent hydrolase